MARRHVSFSVHPKFSAGSGAGVSEEIALRVASQEKEEYERCLEGLYGEELKLKASAPNALKGIVEKLEEKRGGWNVTDLITGERFWRGYVKPRSIQTGDRVIQTAFDGMLRQRTGRLVKSQPLKLTDRGSVSYYVTYEDSEGRLEGNQDVMIERPEVEP